MSTQAEPRRLFGPAPRRLIVLAAAAGALVGYAMGQRATLPAVTPEPSRYAAIETAPFEDVRILRAQIEALRHGAEIAAGGRDMAQAELMARMDRLEQRLLKLESRAADPTPTGALGAPLLDRPRRPMRQTRDTVQESRK